MEENFISSLLGNDKATKVNNPDELNDYMKVLKPYTIFALIALMIFAVGIFVWGIFGKVTAQVTSYIDVYQGDVDIYIDSFNKEKVKKGMTIKFNDRNYIVDSIDDDRILIDDEFIDSMYIRQITNKEIGLHRGDYITTIKSKDLKAACENTKDGFYTAKIEIESISPIKYMFN